MLYLHSTQVDTVLASDALANTLPSTSPAAVEWILGSAVASSLTQKWLCESEDPDEIADLLKWKFYRHRGGWYVRSVNPETGQFSKHGQFKPSSPLESDGKPQKYISFPKGKGTEPLFAPMTLDLWIKISERQDIPIANEDLDETREDLGFWKWVAAHPELPITITEGAKKAASLLSKGEIAIALSGVWNGQQKGKLHSSLMPFIVPGRTVKLIFDSDVTIKPQVEAALIQFGRLCKQQKAEVFIVQWDLELGKGIDDLIVNQGEEKFREILGNAMPQARFAHAYRDWLQSLENHFPNPSSSDSQKKQKLPPADELAHRIAEDYRNRLAYNNESGFWMRYEADLKGVWSRETDEYIEAILSKILDGLNITGYGSHSYITNIVKKLRCLLIERFWNEKPSKELIPFQNGVLEVQTRKFLPHSPGYKFTWALPRDYNLLATDYPHIDHFLTEAVDGNEKLKNILLCFCNAVLLGRSDLQRFLHLIGPGGTGKGTFMRLLTDLIGLVNMHSSTLEDICSNRFELANIYKKRLVVLWDEDKKSGNLGRFKSLTGEDYLRAEEKGKKAFSFKYDGMVVISSNFPIFVGDNSSGLARRLLLVPFSQRPSQRKNLAHDFQGELSAFTNYLLSLDGDFVTRTLLGLDPVPEITLQSWEQRIRTDSIASWLNDCVIFDAIATTPIGYDRTEGLSGDVPTTLYGSYALHCHRTGTTPKANKNFSPDLLELCLHILGMTVEKCHTKVGKQIKGLRLRTPLDFDLPTLDFQMMQSVTDGVTGRVTGQDVESVSLIAFGDGSNTTPYKNEKVLDAPPPELKIEEEPSPPLSMGKEDGVLPVTIPPTQSNQPFDPSPHPSPSPSSSPIDYSSYPHRTSDDLRAKENRATKCRDLMLGCTNSEELAVFKSESGFSENEIKWVYKYLLSPSEKETVKQAAITEQLTLSVTENLQPDSFTKGDLVYYLDNRNVVYTYLGSDPHTGSVLIQDSQGRSYSCLLSQLSKLP